MGNFHVSYGSLPITNRKLEFRFESVLTLLLWSFEYLYIIFTSVVLVNGASHVSRSHGVRHQDLIKIYFSATRVHSFNLGRAGIQIPVNRRTLAVTCVGFRKPVRSKTVLFILLLRNCDEFFYFIQCSITVILLIRFLVRRNNTELFLSIGLEYGLTAQDRTRRVLAVRNC